jgi:hypothetical protein
MSTRHASRTRRPDRIVVIKDVGSYLLGCGLIIHQALFVSPQDFNLTLVLMGGALVGVPGVSQLLASRIGSSPSPDQRAESPPPSPLPSPNASGVDP